MQIPNLNEELNQKQIKFLQTFTKSCRHSILQMVVNAQSGHPGGSLSSIDYLATLYAFIISQTGNQIVISHGHISPAVYSTLGEMGYINKKELIRGFRKFGSIYEGHITRHVNGIDYGTGPLGVGGSVASAFAMSKKMKNSNEKVFCLMGDGEAQEGQVYEMINFAKHYKLNNLITFVDYNKVQLTASLEETMDINIPAIFAAADWTVIKINAHNFEEIWKSLSEAYKSDKPVVIIGDSIMGKGIDFMEETGKNNKSDWHGKTPAADLPETINTLEQLNLNEEEINTLEQFRSNSIKWTPKKSEYPELLSETEINPGEIKEYEAGTITDCRSAYGNALLDLAKNNKNILALTADVKGSVKTDGVSKELPEQYIECGIAEQNMISAAGGFSLNGYTPFTSTFGAFISSRAKDQARVNDINHANVKMVSTHCGLSVGEDGPTHQAIDDMGSFLGFFNTMIIEPADANQTDHIIRYIASHYGNFYVRMGRHKFPVILKENGSLFYDKNYKYKYGKCDIIREGKDLTIAASGAMVDKALKALEILKNKNLSIEIVAVSSIKKFDQTLIDSIKKTKKVLTIEDHNTLSGLGSQLASLLQKENINTEKYETLGVEEYQLSGTADELYNNVGLSPEKIANKCTTILS